MTGNMVVDIVIGTGAIAAALTAVAVLIERVWGPVKRWTQDAIVDPIVEPLEQRMDEIAHYTRYHLGPNHRATPLHEQIKEIRSKQEDFDHGQLQGPVPVRIVEVATDAAVHPIRPLGVAPDEKDPA